MHFFLSILFLILFLQEDGTVKFELEGAAKLLQMRL